MENEITGAEGINFSYKTFRIEIDKGLIKRLLTEFNDYIKYSIHEPCYIPTLNIKEIKEFLKTSKVLNGK